MFHRFYFISKGLKRQPSQVDWFYRVSLSFPWFLPSFTGIYEVLLFLSGVTGFCRVSVDSYGFLLGFIRFYGVLLDFIRFYEVLLGFYRVLLFFSGLK